MSFLWKNIFSKIGVIVLIMCLGAQVGWGQISLTALPQTATENFSTLGTSSLTWNDNSTLNGWYISSGTPLPINTGSTNTNSCYNFGVSGVNPLSDRALGAISTSTTHRYGVRFKNNSSSSIASFTITFTGEQWRQNNSGTLTFEYQVSSSAITSLTAGSWTSASTFNFTSPQSGTAGALDGNANANRTFISGTLNVAVASGSEIFFRWTRAGTNSPGLAIDDLSITANASGPKYWDANGATAGLGGSSTWGATSFNTDGTGGAGGSLTSVGSTDDAIFAGTVGTVTLGANQSAQSMTFSTTGYTLATSGVSVSYTLGGTLSLPGSSLTIAPGTPNLAIAGVIGGSSATLGISGAGAGRVEISGTNTFSNTANQILITGNEVRFSSDLSMGAAPGSVIANSIIIDGGRWASASASTYTINANRGIQVGAAAGTSLSVVNSGTITYNGIIADRPSNTGILVKQGAGILSLGGVSTYSGSTSINNGTLQLTTGNNRLPVGTLLTLGQAASENLGTLDLNGRSQQVSGIVSINGTNATALNNTITSATAATLTISGSSSNVYSAGTNANSGVITGAITLVKSGTGTQTFGESNTYTGKTTITGGYIAGNGESIFGTAPSPSFIADQITLNGGGVQASGGSIDFNSTRGLTLGANNGFFDSNGFTITLTNTVSGVGGLVKIGTGTVALAGPHTYTGGTTISGGTLRLNQSNVLADNGSISLNGGTLSTSGVFTETVGGLVLSENSTIALGSTAPRLTFANSSATAWTGGKILTITGWVGTAGFSGTAGEIYFGSTDGTLTPSQLSQIVFTGYTGTATLLGTGELVPQSTGAAAIVLSNTSLSGFTYVLGSGPSASQIYSVSGVNLTPASGNITISASANFEVSINNSTFTSTSVNLAYTGGTLASTPIYIRLKSGLIAGTYSNEIIANSGGGATPQNVTVSGIVTAPEINVKQSSTNYLTGSTYAFASAVAGTNNDIVFAIENLGNATLSVTGIVTGTGFSLSSPPAATISPAATANFTVRFSPTTATSYFGGIILTNNDPNEGSYIINFTATGLVNSLSDVILNTSFTEPTNILYQNYQATNIINDANSIEVAQFDIRDGGVTSDADFSPTTLTAIAFGLTNSSYIRKVAIYDGSTEIAEVAGAATFSISGLSLVAPDNGTKTFRVLVSFATTVGDNQQYRFTISGITASGAGSLFAAPNGGGAQSSIFGNDNRIIVTATKLAFLQQPTSTTVNTNMSPAVTVRALDAFNNLDADYVTTVSLAISTTTCGTLTGSTAPGISGVATFSSLKGTVAESNITLTASSGALTTVVSTAFNFISVPAVTTTLIGWTFVSSVPGSNFGIPVNLSRNITAVGPDLPIEYLSCACSPEDIPSARVDNWVSGSGTKYWQVDFVTTGYSSLLLSSKQRSSNTGPRDFKIIYSIPGVSGAWTDLVNVPQLNNNFTSGVISNYALPAECSNQSLVVVRWIQTSNTNISGGSIGASGASNIDDIFITGSNISPAANLYFRSKQTGSFESACNWESSSDNVTWNQASSSPDYTSYTITIRNGHNISLNSTATLDELVVTVGGTFTLNDFDLIFNNGTGIDFSVYGTFVDNASSANGATFNSGALWVLGTAGNFIKTRNSGATDFRDNYSGGMSSIPASANWIIRYTGASDVSFTSVSATYYPNLTFENLTGTPYSFITRFTGNSDYPRIKGNLDLGGSGTSTVRIINENMNSQPILVQGNLTIGAGSTLTNVGTGFEVLGNVSVSGTYSSNLTSTTVGLKLSGTSVQSISGTGTLDPQTVWVSNASGVVLNRDLSVASTLSLTSGILNVGANTLSFQTGNTPILKTSGFISVNTASNISFGTGGTAFTIPGSTFSPSPSLNNFTVNRTNSLSLGNQDLTVGGTLNLSSGTLQVGSNTVTLNGPQIAGAAAATGLVTSSASSLVYGGAQTSVFIPASVVLLNNLTVNNPNGTTQNTSTLTIGGTTMITAGGINLSGNSLTLNGNTFADLGTIVGTGSVISNGYFRTTNPNGFSGTGATISQGIVTINSGSLIEFAGSSTTTMAGTTISPANTFNNVLVSGGATKYLPSGFNLTDNGLLNILSNNTVDGLNYSLALPATATVSVAGTFATANSSGFSGISTAAISNSNNPTITLLPGSTINYNGTTQSISSNLIYQNIIFNGSGSKILPNAPAVVNIQGDITNNLTTGGIGFGTSMVSLSGSNLQNINGTGTNTFYNLNINKSTNPVSISGISSMNQIIGILNIQAGPATTLYTNGKLALISLAFGTVSAQTSGAMLDWSTSSPTNGSVNGNVIVQRATLGNDPQNRAFYVSSPVSANLDQLKSTSTNFFWYNETKTSGVVASGGRSQLWESITSPSSTGITAGRGYSVKLKGLPNYSYGTVFAPAGPVFNGQIDYPTTFSTTLNTTTLQGWNLIGNPYPSAIDLNKIPYLSGFSNVGNTFYIWQGDKFGTWTPTSASAGIGTNGASNIVGAMQGFFVQASAAGNVRFNNTIRTSGQSDNLSFYRSSTDPNPMLGLTLSSGSYSDEVKIIFNPSVSANGDFDPAYDAYKLAPLAQVPYFYAEKNGLATALNNLPEITTNTIVPLTVLATSTANYKISSTGASSFDTSVDIYLQDKSNGVLQDLKLNPDYQVNLPMGTYSNRFFIVMRSAVVNGLQGLDAEKVKIYSYEGKVYVHSFYPTAIQASITLQEVSGKTVTENKSTQIYPGINQIEGTSIADGVYVVSFSTEKLKQVAKVILIK